jgi:hypothetical protein
MKTANGAPLQEEQALRETFRLAKANRSLRIIFDATRLGFDRRHLMVIHFRVPGYSGSVEMAQTIWKRKFNEFYPIGRYIV